MSTTALPTQSSDFPAWYGEVVRRAGLAENSSVRGAMVIKPYGYAIWEAIQHELDDRIKATGHENLYFPLLVPECLLIEPTETESKEALDGFIDAMIAIQKEAESQADFVRSAPHTMTVRRLDDVRAARQLDLVWKPAAA